MGRRVSSESAKFNRAAPSDWPKVSGVCLDQFGAADMSALTHRKLEFRSPKCGRTQLIALISEGQSRGGRGCRSVCWGCCYAGWQTKCKKPWICCAQLPNFYYVYRLVEEHKSICIFNFHVKHTFNTFWLGTQCCDVTQKRHGFAYVCIQCVQKGCSCSVNVSWLL